MSASPRSTQPLTRSIDALAQAGREGVTARIALSSRERKLSGGSIVVWFTSLGLLQVSVTRITRRKNLLRLA
jgi:hypothetical protein